MLAIYRIAGFDCEQKFLRISYLGCKRNARGFYIHEYVVCIELIRACAHVLCDRRLLLHPLLSSMSALFTVDSMVQGNHIYKEFRTAILVKNSVVCRREKSNIYDPFAVSVLKSDVIVSHVPRKISTVYHVHYNQLQLIM